ncbi:MAG: PAC2 family protein [Nanoarchaeota archaeon]|nr:PAC2 family protein [Nanoarchaeota archaeon]MBU1643548.1 PAC2 family protein [Nanoarchaeota archaeon]MBU1976638.1 PAC2 family protein [Nanoarchaeota archaeon]
MVNWEITTEAKILPKLKNPIFIEGLPGIGNVGKIAVDFLIEELGAKKLYSFFSHKFPHSVFVNEKNLIDMPKLEVYYKKYDKGNKRDILLLTGDIQPIDEESCYSFCEEIIKIVKHYKCSEMITTGGIGLHNVPEKPRVFCTSNDSKLLKEYVQKGILTEKNIFGVVGPIVGVSGILLGLGKRRKVKGVSLLAETFGNPLYLGIKGAKEILRVLEKKFKYGVDLKKMSKEIIEVENELARKTAEWFSEELSTRAGAKAKNNEVNYIG